MAMLLFSNAAHTQPNKIKINFHLRYEGQEIELGSAYAFQEEYVQFENLRFYISDFRLCQGTESIAKMEKQHCLIDAALPSSLKLNMEVEPAKKYDRIQFNLGIDSLTNVSGAMGGDLDPTKGMYWAWQSGYINFKLEGKTPSCPARNNLFQYHLGGYLTPYYGLQKIELSIPDNAEEINIDVDIDRFLARVDLKTEYEMMRPCTEAVKLAAIAKEIFSVEK